MSMSEVNKRITPICIAPDKLRTKLELAKKIIQGVINTWKDLLEELLKDPNQIHSKNNEIEEVSAILREAEICLDPKKAREDLNEEELLKRERIL